MSERAGITHDNFDSFAALLEEHTKLRQRRASGGTKESSDLVGAIRNFVLRAAKTGVLLSDSKERTGAQAIIDYWCTDLIGLPNPSPDDFKRARLFDPAPEALLKEGVLPYTEQHDARSRDIIRLAATARLWRDSGKSGFLLTGDALRHAAQFRGVDQDINDLVLASKKARQKIRRDRLLFLLGGISVVLLIFIYGVPYLTQVSISRLKDPQIAGAGSGSLRSSQLRLLAWYQRVQQQPFDLSVSGTDVVYEGLDAQGLKLNAPNFSGATLRSINFEQADLRNASFSNTRIKGPASFADAKLSLTQFREADITRAVFDRAELYRAIFDRSCLSEVTFVRADLRQTSFLGASFDAEFKFEEAFRNSPWWLAEGWTSRHISSLTKATQDDIRSARAFQEDLKTIREKALAAVGTATADARTLNDLAWRLAVWGEVSNGPSQPTDRTLTRFCQSPRARNATISALEAAQSAVCIARAAAKSDQTNPQEIANFQDTRAYVLLQLGEADEAMQIYRDDVIPHVESGDVLFRAAVANQAANNLESARDLLSRSIKKRYMPSHELHTLKNYITGEFQRAVHEQIDRFSPPTPPPAYCSAIAE